MPPNVILECNWSSEKGLGSVLTLNESGKPFSTLGLIPLESIAVQKNRVRLFDEQQSSQMLELNLLVEDDGTCVTGLTIVSEIPMFEVFSGENTEYVGTVGGYVVQNVAEIVAYRVDLLLPFRVKNKASLRFMPPAGKRSLWVFGVSVMWEYKPMMPSCVDVNQFVDLLSSGRRKPASDTDMTLVTKLCEIFNSSIGTAEGKTGQRSRGSLDNSLITSLENGECKGDSSTPENLAVVSPPNAPSNSEDCATRMSELTVEFDTFREKVETTLSEHSQRLGLVCEAVLSKARQPHAPTAPVAQDVEKLWTELKNFEAEIRLRMQAQDEKLDAILNLLRIKRENV